MLGRLLEVNVAQASCLWENRLEACATIDFLGCVQKTLALTYSCYEIFRYLSAAVSFECRFCGLAAGRWIKRRF